MKVRTLHLIGLGVLVCGFSGLAQATPLRMDYSVTPGVGLFNYHFTLSLDNHDGTWAAGQGWRWLIFGDVPSGLSPLTGFIGDPTSISGGPWTSFTTTGGAHNGPTLNSVLDYWIPTAVGQTV